MTSDKKHPTFSFQFMPSETFVHLKAYEDLLANFKDLVATCEWYAENGTTQERHHFLKIEARANFLASTNSKPGERGEGE